jgi:S-adenosylhomocysteine hydrolase
VIDAYRSTCENNWGSKQVILKVQGLSALLAGQVRLISGYNFVTSRENDIHTGRSSNQKIILRISALLPGQVRLVGGYSI